MSEVKRYEMRFRTDTCCIVHLEVEHGVWVKGSDMDALLAREAALREELAECKTQKAWWVDSAKTLDERLTAAEQRNARYESLLRQIIPCLAMSTNTTAPTYIRKINEALPQPTESGASECEPVKPN